MGIFDKLFGKKEKQPKHSRGRISKDKERDTNGFKPTDQQIELALLIRQGIDGQISSIHPSGVIEEDKTIVIIVALCSLPQSSKATVFVPFTEATLSQIINDPMVTKKLIDGEFSLLKDGIPQNPKAHVWITDLHGFKQMPRVQNNSYIKNIESIIIEEPMKYSFFINHRDALEYIYRRL